MQMVRVSDSNTAGRPELIGAFSLKPAAESVASGAVIPFTVVPGGMIVTVWGAFLTLKVWVALESNARVPL